MVIVPLLVITFVQYTALATKIEILNELQDKGKDTVSPNKKLLALRLISIVIAGLTVLGIVWFMLHKMTTVLEQL